MRSLTTGRGRYADSLRAAYWCRPRRGANIWGRRTDFARPAGISSMRRRDLLIGGLLATSWPTRSPAQPKGRVRQILLIGHAWSEPWITGTGSPWWAMFMSELRHHGYAEGANLLVSRHEGWLRDWPRVREDILRLSPDVMVTTSLQWARRLGAVSDTIPIVVSALSPVEQGLIASLARPAGNITGIAIDIGPDFHGKQLDFLLETAPKVSHVACLGADTAYPGMRQLWGEAKQRGVSVQEFLFSDNYEPVFTGMVQQGANAVLVLAEAKHISRISLIARLARQHQLPLVSPFRRLTEMGGLMSYGVDWTDIDRRLAVYAARILDGAKPSDLPVEQPSRFELVLNLQAAEHLGLSFPPSLMFLADDVIERDQPSPP
jgi:putative tryptophan/tyrosine transport system substrate-binding protein